MSTRLQHNFSDDKDEEESVDDGENEESEDDGENEEAEDVGEEEEEEDDDEEEREVDSTTIVDTEVEGDLRKIVNSAELGDVTFLCEDGISVHGCRILLAARSSYFKTLLFGKMAESTKSGNHPSGSPVFLFQNFVVWQDGRIDEIQYTPADSFVLLFNHTVKFFMIEKLGEVITKRLKDDIPTLSSFPEDAMERVATNFSVLCDYSTVWATADKDNSVRAIYQVLLQALSSQDLSHRTLACLSKAAFRAYLEETEKIYCRGVHAARLIDEYLRVRQILIWCVVAGDQGKRDIDATCLPDPQVSMDYIDAISGSEVTKELGSEVAKELKRAEFDFTRGRRSFASCIDRKALQPWLKFIDFTSVRAELLYNIIEPFGILEPADLFKVYRAQAMRLSRQLRDTESSVANVWQVFAQENIRRIPSQDECTLTIIGQRKAHSFGAVVVAGLVNKVQGPCKWEFSATPRGSLERHDKPDIVKFEIGFLGLKLGEPFPRDLKKSLSSDVRCSAVRVTVGYPIASVYCQGRTLKQWCLPCGTKFQWTKPMQVSLNDGERGSCIFRYAGEEMRFKFPLPKDNKVYPAISFALGGCDPLLVKPHYDQLSMKIQNFVGFDECVVPNPFSNSIPEPASR
ncbi:hypothetical protein R1sor_015720 [Riccia sorocarpa]|uniref:BTB domain-containing protein n=1 Tax=Riccia sorocarpa TaxID=122646 RepID=A0ABD3HH62_9MARC